MRRVTTRATFTLAIAAASALPASAQATPEVVTLKAPDGLTLKATYYPAPQPGPAILLLHQCNRDRTAWARLAASAAARGFHVLALDYRGFGESEGAVPGNAQEQTVMVAQTWPGDVDAAFAWLTSRPGVDGTRVGAAGASCGVNQSAQLARRHPEVKTLVLLSGGIQPDAREYLGKAAWMPVLAAASLDDGGAAQQMRWLTAWSKHPKSRFVEFKKAGHGTDMFAVEPGLEPMIVDWFDAHLRQAPAAVPAQAPPAPPSPMEEFWKAVNTPGGVGRAREIYQREKAKDPKVVLFPENEMNLQGYQFLQEDRVKDAIEVFRLNTETYPASANTYDSLSDAYLADGNKGEALRYAEKALAVLATDTQVNDALRAAIRESAEKKVRDLKK